MKYAIVQSGGRQHRCEEGGAIEVDHLPVEAGATHTLTEVLLLADDSGVKVGTPTVTGAQVTTTVLEHVKGPKLFAFRYKAKERQQKRTGHRQTYTKLKIDKIEG
jgi:large subunit ribosomal protein L21